MNRELQTLNHNSKIAQWSRLVEDCRNSSLSVTQWCRENGISVSSYYYRQKQVFNAIAESQKICFKEVTVTPADPIATATSVTQQPSSAVALVQYSNANIEVYPNADSKTLRAIFEALKSC